MIAPYTGENELSKPDGVSGLEGKAKSDRTDEIENNNRYGRA